MQHFLLTGAGFSRNWGGVVADEVFEFLLSVTDGDDGLRDLLWRDRQARLGFEDTLARLQSDNEAEWTAQREQDLRNLTLAVQHMFGSMTRAFSVGKFGPRPTDPSLGIVNFLAQFDAIFTLNQDTLLEQQYIPFATQEIFPHSLQFPGYTGAHRPGIVRALDSLTLGPLADRIELYKPEESSFVVGVTGKQPYVKLHGSIDIQQNDREVMLIVGGNKPANIDRVPLLKWYHEMFQRLLQSNGARLMIIGYSFGDEHVNRMIFSGIENGLKIFIVDPLGVKVIESDHDFSIRNAIIGASRRPLLDTLAGKDMVELNKFNRFLRKSIRFTTHHPAL